MAKIIHIYSSDKEIDKIFDEAVCALNRALELFMMIQHQDSAAKIMVKKTYNCFKIAEECQKGWVPYDS